MCRRRWIGEYLIIGIGRVRSDLMDIHCKGGDTWRNGDTKISKIALYLLIFLTNREHFEIFHHLNLPAVVDLQVLIYNQKYKLPKTQCCPGFSVCFFKLGLFLTFYRMGDGALFRCNKGVSVGGLISKQLILNDQAPPIPFMENEEYTVHSCCFCNIKAIIL